MKFKSWFALSKKKGLEERRSAQDAAIFISSIVLAVVFGVLPMPVVWKWTGWFFCFWGVLYIVAAVVDPINRLPLKTTRVAVSVFLVTFVCVFRPLAKAQWREEKAAVLEGDLIGAGPILDDGNPHGFPMLQVGETVFVMTPNGVRDIFPFFPDSGVRSEWGVKGWPLITTTVRDHNGNLVAEVVRNHWRVYPAYSADKNYTNDALEVLDSAGHVVLQVKIQRDKILLLGEWWDVQGKGIRIMKPAIVSPNNGSHIIRMNRQAQHLDELVWPIFEYPSKDHWGEFKK